MTSIANFISKYWFAAFVALLVSTSIFIFFAAIDQDRAINKACTIHGMVAATVDNNTYCVEPQMLVPVEV